MRHMDEEVPSWIQCLTEHRHTAEVIFKVFQAVAGDDEVKGAQLWEA